MHDGGDCKFRFHGEGINGIDGDSSAYVVTEMLLGGEWTRGSYFKRQQVPREEHAKTGRLSHEQQIMETKCCCPNNTSSFWQDS